MKHWPEFKLFRGAAQRPEPAAAVQEPQLLDFDLDLDQAAPDLLTEDALSAQDAEVADRDLLAAVLAQAADAPAPVRPETRPDTHRDTAPRARPAGTFALPGFEGKCRVKTIFGDLPIEALRRRDKVKTISGAYREVVWVDAIRLDADFMSRHAAAHPVQIRAKALGGVAPVRNMLVSPGQQVWVPKVSDGYYAADADTLTAQPNMERMRRAEITYYRFHLGTPEKVCVEGAWFLTAPDA